MTLDLATARTSLLDHLDDDGTRWSTAAQDRALAWGLDACLREYAGSGGTRFDVEASFTSTSGGLVDLSSVAPLAVRSTTLVVGVRHFPIFEIKPEERNILDDTARTWTVRYTPSYSLPTAALHPLVGTGAVAAPSWTAFANYVVLKAAIFASVKDAEARPELQSLAQVARDAVMLDPAIPKATRFPGRPSYYSQWFCWYWRPDLRKIQICKRV